MHNDMAFCSNVLLNLGLGAKLWYVECISTRPTIALPLALAL